MIINCLSKAGSITKFNMLTKEWLITQFFVNFDLQIKYFITIWSGNSKVWFSIGKKLEPDQKVTQKNLADTLYYPSNFFKALLCHISYLSIATAMREYLDMNSSAPSLHSCTEKYPSKSTNWADRLKYRIHIYLYI